MNHYNSLNTNRKSIKFNEVFKKLILLFFVIIIALIFATNSFIVHEDEIVIISSFGKVIKIINKPGLYFKVPLINSTSVITKKNIYYDSQPIKLFTRDNKSLLVDSYTIWKINNPIEFIKTAQTVGMAEIRIDNTINSVIRTNFGAFNYNDIFNINNKIDYNQDIVAIANEQLRIYGIDIIDVRVSNIALPQEIEDYIFARMKSDREKISAQYLSMGEKEATQIRAETDKQVKIIISKASAEAESIRSKADTEAAKIYSKSYNKDPEFYGFMRTLESYKKTLVNKPTIIIPINSPYAKYLLGK